MKHSHYQIEIFKTEKTTTNNIVVSATAGSGKTTTLVELLNQIKPFKRVGFFAFNNSIVDELNKRIKFFRNAECSTLHSFGMSQLFSLSKKKIKFNQYKSITLLDKLIKTWDVQKSTKEIYKWNLVRLYDLFRMNYKSDVQDILSIQSYYDIALVGDELNRFEEYYEMMLNYNLNNSEVMCDFTDMIYLPLLYNLSVKQFDVTLIDELQDLNEAQRLLALKTVKKGGKFIGVGDPEQSVYSFAGADIYSFEKFKNIPNTVCLPLSISYRCSKAVVEKAREIYDTIEPWENAQEGEVSDCIDMTEINDKDFILCRNNAPLMYCYLNLIKRGQKCYIKGIELGEQLIKICEDISSLSIKEGIVQLKVTLNLILQDLIEKKHPAPRSSKKYKSFSEKIRIIEYLGEERQTVREIIYSLKEIYREEGEGVVLMTIHKSKGLESECVYIIRPSLLGGNKKYITQVWQIVQEQNLKFVAYTRAKRKLSFVPESIFNDEKEVFKYGVRTLIV